MSLHSSLRLGQQLPPLRKPILCYVTDRRSLALSSHASNSTKALLEKIEAIAGADLDWIQLREKDLSGRACAAIAHEALARVSRRSDKKARTRIIVNDRLDVAVAEGAGGVHLGENSISVSDARRLISSQELSPDFLLGVSCHSLEAARFAASGGADYVIFGPVFATPSKATHGAPQGLAALAAVCANVKIPVIAIGGITLENAASCFSTGAFGIAAIRLFQDASDPTNLVRALRRLVG